MARVLAAFTALLLDRPFNRITMAHIADRSQTSLPSIYARFEDKNALLLAAHEVFKLECEAHIERLVDDVVASSASIEDILRLAAQHLCDGYAGNKQLLRSALLSGSPVIYDRAAQLMQRCSDRIAELMMLRLGGTDVRRIGHEADFAMRAAFALLQQALIFEDFQPSRFALTDAEMLERIVSLLIAAARRASAPGKMP